MPKIKTTPKDFFLHLAVFTTLYVSSISLLRLLFEIINTVFKDPLEYSFGFSSGSLRAAIASLIVVFPLYLFLSRLNYKWLSLEPAKAELWIRKWLIYLTLFVAGGTATVDLIMLINRFLEGDLTTRFILKVLVVFVVAGAIFGYFMYDLRREIGSQKNRMKILAVAASAAVLLSIVGGFFVVGSPKTERLRRFDEERVSDLQNIQWQVINYWQSKEALPEELEDLEDSISGFVVPTDPETEDRYEYNTTAGLSFNLCATFTLESEGIQTYDGVPRPRSIDIKEQALGLPSALWEHDSGRVCFDRIIDPELYPPRKD